MSIPKSSQKNTRISIEIQGMEMFFCGSNSTLFTFLPPFLWSLANNCHQSSLICLLFPDSHTFGVSGACFPSHSLSLSWQVPVLLLKLSLKSFVDFIDPTGAHSIKQKAYPQIFQRALPLWPIAASAQCVCSWPVSVGHTLERASCLIFLVWVQELNYDAFTHSSGMCCPGWTSQFQHLGCQLKSIALYEAIGFWFPFKILFQEKNSFLSVYVSPCRMKRAVTPSTFSLKSL